MRVKRVFLACVIVGLLQSPVAVWAQYNNSGSSYGGASSARQGIFGSRTMGGAGTRSGRGTFGSGAGGAGDALSVPSDIASARFVRGNRQAGDFVGGSAQNMDHFVGGVQDDMSTGNSMYSGGAFSPTMSGGGYPNSRQNANRNQQGQQGGTGNAGQTATSIRTVFSTAFDRPQPTSEKFSTSLTRRLAQTSASQPRVQVELQGRTAILRGVVASEHDRSLMEQLIRLEPGIDGVNNEIVVGTPTPAELTLP